MKKLILDGAYEIYESGEVYSHRSNRFLKGGVYPNGYEFVGLSVGGKTKPFLRHRLVAIAFVPNPKNLPYVNHIDGNKRNNRVENLEWCTAAENVQHAIQTGLINKVCKIEKTTIVRNLETDEVLKFDTEKECCDFFGFTKCWLGNYQRRNGNPCLFRNYEISVFGKGGSVCE